MGSMAPSWRSEDICMLYIRRCFAPAVCYTHARQSEAYAREGHWCHGAWDGVPGTGSPSAELARQGPSSRVTQHLIAYISIKATNF